MNVATVVVMPLIDSPLALLLGAVDVGAIVLVGGGLALLSVAAWLQTRQWRRRHILLSSDFETVTAERSQAEHARIQAEVFYHSLVETIPQMILCKDLEGHFTFANQKFCAELGTTLENFQGKTDYDFFPSELADKYRRDDTMVLASGHVLDIVEQHVTPRGEKLYVQVMKAPLREADGKPIGIQVIFWDVTERMLAEEKLKEQNIILHQREQSEREAHQALKAAQSRMVETEKLASLGQLVAGVAHEINNPLAFVSNNVAVLERDLRDIVTLLSLYRQLPTKSDLDRAELNGQINTVSEQLDLDYTLDNMPRLIERTREGLRRIERIVKDLRLFARVDEGEWNEVDLNPGIESSVNMVQGYARKKSVRLVTELESAPFDSLSRCAVAPGRRQFVDERDRRLPAGWLRDRSHVSGARRKVGTHRSD